MTDLDRDRVLRALADIDGAIEIAPDITATQMVARLRSDIEQGVLDVRPPAPAPRRPVEESGRPTRVAVRRRDRDTSFEAAIRATTPKGESQALKFRLIYQTLLTDGPFTDDELRARLETLAVEDPRYRIVPSTVTKRRGDLEVAGWVRDSGQQRPGNSGSPFTVWEAVPEERG